ncbi:unnamed protein product [Parascedosporium putredinis]|uniref:DUF1996 domain-containing protein n=1 Tax=Parascedosporium putredinis TaxID=1442378 RepID=A0A9P1GXX0_9PEZI|nr:unnamed protein product [Parascedosporium putredinis]CAI7990202.1 unnamed protein product [Parascedosporium putredinis]
MTGEQSGESRKEFVEVNVGRCIGHPLLVGAGFASAYTVTNVGKFMEKNIDPIVTPGEYRSHLHTFFGSDAVNVNTTTSAELQAGCSTAENPNDFSSYWIPSLVIRNDDGSTTPVPIFRFSAYYVDINAAEVPIPQNYRAVVGNAAATAQADVPSLAGHSWFCEGDPSDQDKDPAAFPRQTCSTHLQTLLLFHDCVDETTSRRPTRAIRYDLRKALPGGWEGAPPFELACGSQYCFHGDFINGWLPEAAENMLLANSKRDFAGVDGPNGVYNAGSVCTRAAVDVDPDHGTSDFLEARDVAEKLANVPVTADDEASTPTTSSETPTAIPVDETEETDAEEPSVPEDVHEDVVVSTSTQAVDVAEPTAPVIDVPIRANAGCSSRKARRSHRARRASML